MELSTFREEGVLRSWVRLGFFMFGFLFRSEHPGLESFTVGTCVLFVVCSQNRRATFWQLGMGVLGQ